jgi:hypothetical protein
MSGYEKCIKYIFAFWSERVIETKWFDPLKGECKNYQVVDQIREEK